ncbi:restriction endonuclease subunit S [Gracilimonas sediminicola]|uniref:restriction endonuclease subunit S n=1 Tax=Gracilimonas sediminicola TaxID=2952158 RepID=UPI0038D4414F
MQKTNSVKNGYKKTKFGLIPKDWKVKSLQDASEKLWIGLVTTMTTNYVDEGVPLIKNSDINPFGIIHKELIHLDEEFARKHSNRSFKEGDIVTVHTGDVGVSAIIDKNLDGAIGFATLNTRWNPKEFHNEFVAYFFNSHRFLHTAVAYSTGDGRQNLNLKDFRKFVIPVPSLPEQKKIAELLSTWDRSIERLEQLISKKEEIKKGLMQQLLSGKSRFSGFKKEWQRLPIEKIGDVIRGASPRPKGDPKYYGGNIPRLMVEDVTRDGKYVTPKVDFLTEVGAEKSRFCRAGTLTVVCSGNVGTPSFLAVDACIHDGFLGIRNLSEKINKDYLYYQILQLKDRLERSATHGGVFTNLTTTILKEFVLPIPPIDEQKEIAKCLTMIDDEIFKYQKYLSKIKSQKKGLMQQLLTGKTRVEVKQES